MVCVSGVHVSHKDLPYNPFEYSAITSYNHSQVIVNDRRSTLLHIYQLPSVDEIRTIRHTELDLEKSDQVFAVHHADNKLHLAVGGDAFTKALHVYEVRPHLTVMMIQTTVLLLFYIHTVRVTSPGVGRDVYVKYLVA